MAQPDVCPLSRYPCVLLDLMPPLPSPGGQSVASLQLLGAVVIAEWLTSHSWKPAQVLRWGELISPDAWHASPVGSNAEQLTPPRKSREAESQVLVLRCVDGIRAVFLISWRFSLLQAYLFQSPPDVGRNGCLYCLKYWKSNGFIFGNFSLV